MNDFKRDFGYDFYRITGKKWGERGSRRLLSENLNLRFMYCLRKVQAGGAMRGYYEKKRRRLEIKYGLEISAQTKLGKGFTIWHPYAVRINPDVVIGDFCNLHKGVTITRENVGERKGCPTLGNYVWVGFNSTILGKVNIGDDVFIFPNTFVNCDVPAHSLVQGNPCTITPCKNATEGYCNKCDLK